MKAVFVCAAVLVVSAASVHAAITCSYNPQGQYTGADDADARFPVNQVTAGGGPGVSSDYAWNYTVDGPPSDCPKMLPAHFNAGQAKDKSAIYLFSGMLTAVPGGAGKPGSLQLAHPKGGYVTVIPCVAGSYDAAALAKLAGKKVTVSGRYGVSPGGGKFCATGFIGE